MSHLSRKEQIHRVIFVNPEVWLMHLIFNFREQMSPTSPRLYTFSWKAVLPRKVGEKVTAFTPLHFIPGARSSRLLGRLQTMFHAWVLNRLLGKRDFILVLNDFNLNSSNRELVRRFREKAKLVVFDWSDDFVESFHTPEERRRIGALCEQNIREADVVLTVNDDLTQRAGTLNSHSYTILNGTDFDPLSKAVSSEQEVPESLRRLAKPLIGYIGWMSQARIDLGILARLSEAHPDWTIVMMGPVVEKFIRLCAALKNVVFLPPVDYQVLPRYLSFFDVCIIPHHVNDETRGNNPLKLYNYLAAGKPVVSTPISGLESFQDVVYLAKDKEEFLKLTEQAMREDDPGRRQERLRKARENSWPVRGEEIWKILEDHLFRAAT